MKYNRFFKNKKGMTLIELIVVIALLSIILILIGNVFLNAFNILGKASQKKVKSMDAAAGIELTTADTKDSYPEATVSKTKGDFQITFGGEVIIVSGNYLSSSSSSGDVIYKSFVPDP